MNASSASRAVQRRGERSPSIRGCLIGADGRHSLVAEAVTPSQYHEKPPLLAAYYTYWSGLPIDGRFETYIRAAPRIRSGAHSR